MVDTIFLACTHYLLDSINAEAIGLALKSIESQYGPIIYLSSDSGSQLRESLLNPIGYRNKPTFSWISSNRCGPKSQKHNYCESKTATFKKFAYKVFKNKICVSRITTDLVLTLACVSMNKIPIDKTENTLISPFNLLYPSLQQTNYEAFGEIPVTSLRNIFKHCRQTTELIKSTYNQALSSNFQKYLLKDEKNSWPELKINNIVIVTFWYNNQHLRRSTRN